MGNNNWIDYGKSLDIIKSNFIEYDRLIATKYYEECHGCVTLEELQDYVKQEKEHVFVSEDFVDIIDQDICQTVLSTGDRVDNIVIQFDKKEKCFVVAFFYEDHFVNEYHLDGSYGYNS